MIAAPVQCDIDGIPKGSHHGFSDGVATNIGSFPPVDLGDGDILRDSVAGDVERFRPGTSPKDQAPRGHPRQARLWRPIVLVQPKGVARDRIGSVLGSTYALGPAGTATRILDVTRCGEGVHLAVVGDFR